MLNRAAALGSAWLGNDGRIHPDAVSPDLRNAVVRAAARAGERATFEVMEARARAVQSPLLSDFLARKSGSIRETSTSR